MNHVSEISDDSMETVIWFGVSVVAKPSQPVEFERSDGFYCSALGTGCRGTKLGGRHGQAQQQVHVQQMNSLNHSSSSELQPILMTRRWMRRFCSKREAHVSVNLG